MVTKALFLYSSQEGQTSKILNFIAEQLTGVECEIVDLHQVTTVDFAAYDQILIGASIRYGHLHKKLYQFIEQNHVQLTQHKAGAFACINLTARKEHQGKDTPEGNAYVRTFLGKSLWQPDLIGVFAGAVRYPQYRWFDKKMIQLIMRMTGGETDITKEVEYTNWDKVALFAQKFKQFK